MKEKIRGKHYYTAQEVADELGLSIRTIYTYVKTGKLKKRKIGRVLRFLGSDIEEYLK